MGALGTLERAMEEAQRSDVMEDDPLGWVTYVITEVVPYLVRETVGMIADAVAEHPAGLLLALLAALGLWKLVEALGWILRKAWIPLLFATVVGLVVTGVLRI